MLLNLDYWRENDSEKHLLDFAKKERYVFYHDQDALNKVFQDQWFSLSPIWNKFNMYPWWVSPHYFTRWEDKILFEKYPLVIHYAGYVKPWFNLPFVPSGKLYRKFLRLTPWKDVKSQNKLKWGGVLRIFLYICRCTWLRFMLILIVKNSRYKKYIYLKTKNILAE
jgi:lipopolysaccharide biosynthesis glycosyltransferase